MTRIFLTLSVLSSLTLAIAFGLGYVIGDARVATPAVQGTVSQHMLVGLAAIIFAMLSHSLALTYLIGTGRWIEETSIAYRLSPAFRGGNSRIKKITLPPMILCVLLLIAAGAIGAASDPASPVGFRGIAGLTGAQTHFVIASAAWLAHMLLCVWELIKLGENGQIVNGVLAEVKRIRRERGLDIDEPKLQ